MNASILRNVFVKLNGRVLTAAHSPNAETWVLRKPSALRGVAKSGTRVALATRRHMIKAFHLAATLMIARPKGKVTEPAGAKGRVFRSFYLRRPSGT